MVNKRVQNAAFGCNLKNDRMILVGFQGKPFNITVIQVYAPTTNAKEAEQFYEDLQDLLEQKQTNKKKDVFFIIGDWNAKVGIQEIPGVTGKFGLGVNEAGQNRVLPRKQTFAKKTHWSKQTPFSNNTRDDCTHGHHQMVNTEIILIIFFTAKDREALYSQQKDRELTVAQIMNSLLQNSDLS